MDQILNILNKCTCVCVCDNLPKPGPPYNAYPFAIMMIYFRAKNCANAGLWVMSRCGGRSTLLVAEQTFFSPFFFFFFYVFSICANVMNSIEPSAVVRGQKKKIVGIENRRGWRRDEVFATTLCVIWPTAIYLFRTGHSRHECLWFNIFYSILINTIYFSLV